MPHGHRQRADVIVMAMRNRNGVHLGVARLAEQRQPVAAFAFRVHPGVEQNAVVVHLHQPRAGADVRVRIQIRDVHAKDLTTDEHGWTQINEKAERKGKQSAGRE